MNAENSRPRLRALEVTLTEHEDQDAVLLRDPLHLSEAILIVPMGLVPVLKRMDGAHTLADIRRECLAEEKIDFPEENIRELFSHLEQSHFLDGDGFEAWRQDVVDAYLGAPARPSFLAGKSYDADPAGLRSQIEGFFTSEEGPGLPERNGRTAGAPLKGLVAPHIDFQRGGPTFAWSYRALAERTEADTFIVLGTVHAPTQGIYSLTRKDFETPLGALEADGGFVDALAARYSEDLFRDEFAQRGEHSIEFQAVFLRYILPGDGDRTSQRENSGAGSVTFVPILVGSFGEFVAGCRSPAGDDEVEGFIAALRDTAAEFEARGRRVCYLASVDLAHVGPQFGDDRLVDEAQLRALGEADRASLEAVCRGDAEAFYWSVAADGDARKVCGLAPIYTMLRVLEGCSGEVLHYSQWPDPDGTVTFCSVALT
ncbi:MAG: AmmeMemoRadiSam system protein B [Nitrospinota bacterium]|nr:AmmeMemoRadiSam system protein B [Nitrospinota bacterium]